MAILMLIQDSITMPCIQVTWCEEYKWELAFINPTYNKRVQKYIEIKIRFSLNIDNLLVCKLLKKQKVKNT